MAQRSKCCCCVLHRIGSCGSSSLGLVLRLRNQLFGMFQVRILLLQSLLHSLQMLQNAGHLFG